MIKKLYSVLALVCLLYGNAIQVQNSTVSNDTDKSTPLKHLIDSSSPLLILDDNLNLTSDAFKFSKSLWSLHYMEGETESAFQQKKPCNLILKYTPQKKFLLALKLNNEANNQIQFKDEIISISPENPIERKLFKKTLFPNKICNKLKGLERSGLDSIHKI